MYLEDNIYEEMCEWLSCGQWFDVYLSCGGRVFSAHRAVLASVSKFLRQALLSCPAEDSPTFIVLPEFDFDAMSLVLYYIYNGEVIIPKNQLKMFLDTINAMQIFVDSRYLQNNSEFMQKEVFNPIIPKSVIPVISSDESRNDCIKLKREICFTKHSLNKKESDVGKQDSCCSVSELKDIHAGYLKSQWYDRQRQSFSRDLFIETYSLNGNSNGVTESVLAITNEDYHKPTSVLLANANAEDLRTKAVFLRKSHKNTENIFSSLFERRQQHLRTNMYSYGNENNNSKCLKDANLVYVNGKLENFKGEVVDLPFKFRVYSGQNLQQTIVSLSECNIGSKDDVNTYTKYRANNSKMSILNKVLQNPWKPRQPNTYRPFHRKSCNLNLLHLTEDEMIKQLPNDKNNNFNNITDFISNLPTKNDSCKQHVSLKCNFSEQVFPESIFFDAHVKQHGSRYKCPECDKSFSQLRNYKYHMSVHRGTKEFATTCPVCGKYYNDKGYLSSHMKIHRNRKEYKCSMCPKSFNQRVAYNMHVRIHTGVKPHVCDECGKAFSRKMLLKQHQRTHSGERPYACTHCDKRFADRSNMTLHLRLHTGTKPFSCTLCYKSFTKKHHLTSHLNFHTGSKPYSCPRCTLGFTQSSNMRTHLKKCNVFQSDVIKTI